MKKLLMVFVAVMMIASTAQAATSDFGEGAGNKIKRGVVNLFTGIVEFPAQIIKGFNNGFEPVENEVLSKTIGTILGVFRGASHTVGRTSWGALELFGFWAANPESNDGVGIPLDAEYAWEEGTQYSIFDPSLEEGVKPIGHKLVRGLRDGFLGIAELPGQIKKGHADGDVVKGFGKGVWFWFSREVYGLGSLYSCLVPNPTDNPGYAFDQENPWDALAE